MAPRKDSWRKFRKLTHVSWGALIGGLLVICVAVFQIASRGIRPWIESDSALLVGMGTILLGLYDRLHFLNNQACEVTDIIDTFTTDPNDPNTEPFFSMADAQILRKKLGLPH